jgi:hypothetical protein
VQSVPSPRNGALIKPQEATSSFYEGPFIMDVFSAKPFEPLASEGGCANGIDSDEPFDAACMYSTQPPLVCQNSDTGEFGFVMVSCPEYPSQPFKFRVEATSSPLSLGLDDPVAQYWDGQLKHSSDGYLCSDDSKTNIGVFGLPLLIDSLSSEIGSAGQARPESVQTFLPAGAGVRLFYAHQFEFGLNWQNLGFNLKLTRGAANDIWTR